MQHCTSRPTKPITSFSTGGGSRTPNRWIWNPVLCQLSYARSTRPPLGINTPDPELSHLFSTPTSSRKQLFAAAALFLTRFLVNGVPAQFRAVLFQLQTLGTASLFRNPVVPDSRLGALQPNIFPSHDSTPHNPQKNRIPGEFHPENEPVIKTRGPSGILRRDGTQAIF